MSSGPPSAPMQVLADPAASMGAVTEALAEVEKALAGAPVVRMGISANITLDLLGPYLQRHSFVENVKLRVEMGGYDDLPGDFARFADAGLPVALIVLLFDNLLPSFEAQLGTLAEEAVAARRDELRARLDLALARGAGMQTIVVARMHRLSPAAELAASDRVAGVLADFNAILEDAAARFPNVVLVAIDDAIRAIGAARAFDWRFYFRGKAPYSAALLDEFARGIVATTRAFGGYFRKVLVLDCDNTLWGGVIGEDLLDGIELDPFDAPGNVYWRIQNEVAALERRGVLICLCTKNNAADVDEALARHPHMVVNDRMVVRKLVNWDDKVTNLRRIAADLGVGLESLVLVDDSAFECESVRRELPMVRTFQVPATLSEYPRMFDAVRRLFLAGGLSAESASKTGQYQLRAAAEAARVAYTSHDEYLHSLGIKVAVSCDAVDRIPRISELTMKSNQFNVTTRRYTEAQILKFMQDPDAAVYSFSVSDRFGDAGLTGVVIVVHADAEARVDTFLMSCRVIGRGVESAVWAYVLEASAKRGARRVRAEYVPSARNALVADFFDRMEMTPVEGSTQARQYQSELARLPSRAPSWIEVIDA